MRDAIAALPTRVGASSMLLAGRQVFVRRPVVSVDSSTSHWEVQMGSGGQRTLSKQHLCGVSAVVLLLVAFVSGCATTRVQQTGLSDLRKGVADTREQARLA